MFFITPQCNQTRDKRHTPKLFLLVFLVGSFRFFWLQRKKKRKKTAAFKLSLASTLFSSFAFPSVSLPLILHLPDTTNDNSLSLSKNINALHPKSLSISLVGATTTGTLSLFKSLSLFFSTTKKTNHAFASTVFCSDAAKSAYEGVPGPLSSTK